MQEPLTIHAKRLMIPIESLVEQYGENEPGAVFNYDNLIKIYRGLVSNYVTCTKLNKIRPNFAKDVVVGAGSGTIGEFDSGRER